MVAEVTHIEPSQATLRSPQRPLVLASCAFLQPKELPKPVLGYQCSEILLLVMKVGCYVIAQERKEGGDGKGFVTVAKDLEVDGFRVENVREK